MRTIAPFLCVIALVLGTSACSRSDAPADPQPVAAAATPTAATATATAPAADGEGKSCGDSKPEGGSCCGLGNIDPDTLEAAAPVPAEAVWTSLAVDGMTCDGCARRIELTLAHVEGVVGVRVDHAAGKVEVASEGDATAVRDRVAPRIAQLGYTVRE
jgi:copper chaperone CopZ